MPPDRVRVAGLLPYGLPPRGHTVTAWPPRALCSQSWGACLSTDSLLFVNACARCLLVCRDGCVCSCVCRGGSVCICACVRARVWLLTCFPVRGSLCEPCPPPLPSFQSLEHPLLFLEHLQSVVETLTSSGHTGALRPVFLIAQHVAATCVNPPARDLVRVPVSLHVIRCMWHSPSLPRFQSLVVPNFFFGETFFLFVVIRAPGPA